MAKNHDQNFTAGGIELEKLRMWLLVAMCSCIVANLFGDRWTYLEITGLLWVLFAAAARASQFTDSGIAIDEVIEERTDVMSNPYTAYR